MIYDVIIIGGGVTGCCIARSLSKYDLKIALLEKEADIASGTTKANSGVVHAGFASPREYVKRDLCINCLLYTSPSPRDRQKSRMPSSA